MNKRTLLNTLLSLSCLTITNLPASALEINPQTTIENLSQQTTNQTTNQTSNQTTDLESIIVAFPKNIEFDAGGKTQHPVVLRVVEPVYNQAGKIVIPAKSRIDALLVPVGKGKEKGTMIIGKSLIMNGKNYPLNATGINKVPAYKITKKTRLEQAQKYSDSVSKAVPMLSNLNGGIQNQEINQNTMIIQGVSAIAGFLTPRSKLVSSFSQGNEYILHLEKPLSLDTIQNIPVTARNSEIPLLEETNQNTENTQDTETPQNSEILQEEQNTQPTENIENTQNSENTQEEENTQPTENTHSAENSEDTQNSENTQDTEILQEEQNTENTEDSDTTTE